MLHYTYILKKQAKRLKNKVDRIEKIKNCKCSAIWCFTNKQKTTYIFGKFKDDIITLGYKYINNSIIAGYETY